MPRGKISHKTSASELAWKKNGTICPFVVTIVGLSASDVTSLGGWAIRSGLPRVLADKVVGSPFFLYDTRCHDE